MQTLYRIKNAKEKKGKRTKLRDVLEIDVNVGVLIYKLVI